MNGFLSVLVIALLAGAGYFYEYQYQPLNESFANLTIQNQTLSTENAKDKAQIDSLNSQIETLTNTSSADDLKIAKLTAQIKLLQSTPVVVSTPKVFTPPDPLPAQPNWNWSVNGKDYHNVVVTSVEADCIHITYDGGIGDVNQSDLTPELQKLFNYDPALAAAAMKQKQMASLQSDALVQQSLGVQASQNAADAATEQKKVAQLKKAVDAAQWSLDKITFHYNQYGVEEYYDHSRDSDGGAKYAASRQILQNKLDDAKAAYQAELDTAATMAGGH